MVIYNYRQMFINKINYDVDDEEYKIVKFKFEENINKLTTYHLKLCSLFHETFLNDFSMWDYLNNVAFFDLINEIHNLRKTQNITPEKDKMFELFKQSKGSFKLPETLTYINGKSMKDSWYEFLNFCK